ncbi:MAG: hypothetical protein MHMPM18_003699 [Marteilia pararefringens]
MLRETRSSSTRAIRASESSMRAFQKTVARSERLSQSRRALSKRLSAARSSELLKSSESRRKMSELRNKIKQFGAYHYESKATRGDFNKVTERAIKNFAAVAKEASERRNSERLSEAYRTARELQKVTKSRRLRALCSELRTQLIQQRHSELRRSSRLSSTRKTGGSRRSHNDHGKRTQSSSRHSTRTGRNPRNHSKSGSTSRR